MTAYGTDWLYLLVPLAVYAAVIGLAIRKGSGDGALERLSDTLSRRTGLPGWAAAGWITGVTGLLIASLGFYWDVSWHVDLGRDEVIFTPAHTAILVGLGFIPVTAGLVVAIATRIRADVALRWRGWRAPVAAVPLAVLGFGAMAGFPLDEFWHRAYGIDVTMWGPTHLTMIGGASFTPLALLLLLREAGPGRLPRATRQLTAVTCGAVLVGLSTFQLEYDLGVAQWQALYHPVLVAVAGGVALALSRRVLGPGGALIAALHFTAQRALTLLLVGDVLHHTAPHWALYVGAAVAVELAALFTSARGGLAQGLAAGAGVATLGLGTEWAWSQVWARWPWTSALFPEVLVACAAALAAGVLGVAAGRALRGQGIGVPRTALALAGVVVVGSLAVPFPRRAMDATITMRTTPAGPGRVNLDVTLSPPDAVEGANRFHAFAWQGGHSEQVEMVRTGEGTYRAERSLPVGGSWKTLVRVLDGPRLAGAPVYFPRDDEIGAEEIPVQPERVARLERDTSLLMREARAGAAAPAVVAYTAVLAIALAWLASLVFGFVRLSRRPHPLAGKRVVVTGALGGIGVAVVPALREAGADVVGLDLAGADVNADVRDREAVAAAIAQAAERLGGIDVLVNLAGIGRAQDAGDLPDDEARRTLDINFFGTWNATAAAMPWLVDSNGHVVVTASGLAIAVMPYAAAYAASKRAVTAYADVLRSEYHGRITVTTVNPGYVRTPIHDVVGAAGASLEGVIPADPMSKVVEAYLRACADRPRAITTSWRTAANLLAYRSNPPVGDGVIRWKIGRTKRPDPAFVLDEQALADRRRQGVASRR